MSSTQFLKGILGNYPYNISFPSHHCHILYQRKKIQERLAIRPITSHISHSIILANMADTLSSTMAFQTDDYYNPQATISLSDTSLQNSLMTPEPTSPESSYNVKEESVECDESQKPTKKRKSWGQELPTPKTNLPPR